LCIIDANAKEEKLACAKLSIVMNVFEDVCGMQTLGQMTVDPFQLLNCSKLALKTTKEVTKIVRKAWADKDKLPLLQMQISQEMMDDDH